MSSQPEDIGGQLDLAAWVHERRVPKGLPGGGRWVKGAIGLPPVPSAAEAAARGKGFLPGEESAPSAEYGHDSKPVRALRELFRNSELTNGDARPEDQPGQGIQGETEIVTLSDGSKVVFKSQVPERNDREELSYYVSQALDKATGHDTGLPPIARNPDTPWEMVERVVPGKTGMRYAMERLAGQEDSESYYEYENNIVQEIADTWNGHHIGLLDYVTSNSDRNMSNYLVDDRGSPTPIDMGMAQFDGDNYGGSFTAGLKYSPASVARMEAELRKLRPEFQRLGHEDWYVVMMDTVSRLQASPPGFAGRGDAIELASGEAWLHELRKPNGEWARAPGDKPGTGLDRYKVPPHERLINPHADFPDPADMPYFRKHPVSAENIIAAYDATPKEMRPDGMRWYADAHLLSRALAHGNAEEGAILLANYSPQANWPINMFRAARVADEGKPIPKGQGYISGDQVKKAQKALDGQHIDQVLVSPKTRSFAHLLAQGDDSPDDPYGHVVIDAHALNVAEGGTQRGATYQSDKARKKIAKEDLPPIGSDVRAHEYVGDMYRQAASYISHRDGALIKPHQLQAVTWVAQVLANQAEDRAVMEDAAGGVLGRAKGRLSARAKDWAKWLAYAQQHHLQLIPGVSALAAQALLAQVIELVGEDSVLAQLDLAAWEHERRVPKGMPGGGQWVKSPGSIGEQISSVEAQRSKHATEGELRLALIKSQVYTTQQFDKMQAEISHLQAELDKEGKDEAKAVLVTHLAWIGAGIAAALVLTGVGLPPAVALLAATLPTIGSEFSELAVVLGKGRRALAHPASRVREILRQHKQHKPHLAFASDPLHDQAVAAVAQWLAQTGYTGPDASDIADALVTSWMTENAGRVAAARRRDMSGSLAVQALAGEPPPFDSIAAQLMSDSVSTVDAVALAYDPASAPWYNEPRDTEGKWIKLYHGTYFPFQPGDFIEPGHPTNYPGAYDGEEEEALTRVHVTPVVENAWQHADNAVYERGKAGKPTGRQRVFEVEPAGRVEWGTETDPEDYESDEEMFALGDRLSTSPFKVVREIPYQGESLPFTRRLVETSNDSIAAQALDLAFNPAEPRGAHGEWEREAQYQAALAERKRGGGYPVIGPEHARGNSRPVSHEEFQRLAHLGNRWIDRAKRDASPTTGLDRNWPQIRERAFKEAQKPWGGATINPHTGEFLPDGADLYALSVKPRGMVTISVPETSSQQEFEQAMDQARQMFGPALQRAHFHLGVFHDDEHHRIDIDPVAIVDSTDLVDQVGAYTRAIGGAYHFKSGDGHWPPHVAESAGMANDEDQQVHFAGPGQWHTQAVEIQEPEPDDGE